MSWHDSSTAHPLFAAAAIPAVAVQKQVLREMSLEQLIDTIMIHPSVTLSQSGRDTGFISTYSFQPLANLVYMRDQQITTAKGIVLGSLRSHQRQRGSRPHGLRVPQAWCAFYELLHV